MAFTMLADDDALREVLIDSGLLDRLAPPLIHVNMATISVAFAEELASRWKARGVAYVRRRSWGGRMRRRRPN